VLLLDNCRIHKCEELREALESNSLDLLHTNGHEPHIVTGCLLKFIPAYLPDLNPIEESFSAGNGMKKYMGAEC